MSNKKFAILVAVMTGVAAMSNQFVNPIIGTFVLTFVGGCFFQAIRSEDDSE
jgi:hypothetical protein